MTEQISDKMKAVDIADNDQDPPNENGNTTKRLWGRSWMIRGENAEISTRI